LFNGWDARRGQVAATSFPLFVGTSDHQVKKLIWMAESSLDLQQALLDLLCHNQRLFFVSGVSQCSYTVHRAEFVVFTGLLF
jgi:hypothetical protein